MRFSNVNVKICLVVALLAMTLFVTKPASTASANAFAPSTVAPAVDCDAFPALCKCFPSCDKTDGKMVSLSGGALNTFTGGTIEIGFSSPASAVPTDVLIGVFDPNSTGRWDRPEIELQFDIVADKNNDGTGTTILETFKTTDVGFPAAENVWLDRTLTNNVLAKNDTSGDFFYFLRITPFLPIGETEPLPGALNGIKVRTDGTFSLTGQTIQFIAMDEFDIIGDACGGGATEYDGTWDFVFDVKEDTIALELWDGDFDFGSTAVPGNATNKDTDDPNTPPNNVCVDTNGIAPPNCIRPEVPVWSQDASTRAEGVAGLGNTGIGLPPDDNLESCSYVRTPNVIYRFLPPSGGPVGGYVNANPSGTGEWEKFLISTTDATADWPVTDIPAGAWTLHIEGMDVFNQFALHFNKSLRPECEQTIGNLVWEDKAINGIYNGVKDVNELGLAAVPVSLFSNPGCNPNPTYTLFATTATDSNGEYKFTGLPRGCYQVQVSTPVGYEKTTDGNQSEDNTSKVLPYNVNLNGDVCMDHLKADFGYKRQCECDIKVIETDFYCEEFKLKIKNEGNCNIVLSNITIEFPLSNGKLDKVVLNGQTIADVYLPSPAVIPPGLTNNLEWKTITPDKYKLLVFKFTNNASTDKSKYKVKLNFGDCMLEFPPPVVCDECKLKTYDVSWYCDELKWTVKNEGNCPVVLTNFNLTWPGSINGKLDFIKTSLGTLYSSPDIGSPYAASLVAGNLGAESARTIAPGTTKTFYIDFYNNASTDKSKYTGSLKFGNCEVKFPTPPPVNCDCSKITTVKYKVYGDQLLWTIKNDGNCDLQLTYLNFDWLHDYNGKLSWIKLGNDLVWDGSDVYSPWSFSPGTSGKKIAPGETKTLTFDFCNNAKNDPKEYTGYIKFGTCKKDFPTSWKY